MRIMARHSIPEATSPVAEAGALRETDHQTSNFVVEALHKSVTAIQRIATNALESLGVVLPPEENED